MRNNIGLFLAKRAHLNPELEALVEAETERRFSYRDLNERANRFANALLDKGIRKGDRVAFLLRNCAEFVEGFFAVGKIGGVMVPLNSRLVPDELEFILKDSGASVLIFDAEFASAVESLHPRHTSVESWIDVGGESPSVDFAERYDALMDQASAEEPRITTRGEDLFLIVYTSGTTGRPKGAMHTHDSVMWASLTWVMTLDVRALDRFLLFLPPFHVGVLLPLTMLTHRGGTVVMMRTFEPGRVFELVEQEKITTTLAVPTMFHLMLQHPGIHQHDLSTLRWSIVGAGPVPGWLIERYAALGIDVLQDYGLTESGAPGTVISAEEAAAKPDSAGKACFHTEVRVVDGEGKDVPVDELGEIIIRARHLMTGYWNRPEATSEVLRDGWLYTGDIGTLDEDGCLYIRDRKKDMIVSGGENIYPVEVENLLLDHPKIKDVAVVGQTSTKWGESAVAIVVLEEGEEITSKEIVEYCREKIAGYKVPRILELTHEIPRTPTGKIQKHMLKERFPGPAPE